MTYSKFTSMTASLIARNGEAAPTLALVSAIPDLGAHWAPEPDGPEMHECGLRPADDESALLDALVGDGYARWRSTQENDSADGRPAQRPKARKLFVALTEAEYEALTLIAARTGLSRHQAVRRALDGYFKWLAVEYAGTCRCISTPCSNAASATAESEDRSPERRTVRRASKRAH